VRIILRSLQMLERRALDVERIAQHRGIEL